MKYAVDMGSDAMIYIPSFIEIGSTIQKLIRGIQRHTHTHTHTAWRCHKPIFIFSK
jgi:hypothetical protein